MIFLLIVHPAIIYCRTFWRTAVSSSASRGEPSGPRRSLRRGPGVADVCVEELEVIVDVVGRAGSGAILSHQFKCYVDLFFDGDLAEGEGDLAGEGGGLV